MSNPSDFKPSAQHERALKNLYFQLTPLLINQNQEGSIEEHRQTLSNCFKKISQLIAQSWLPGNEEIQEIFNEGKTRPILDLIKEKKGIDLEEILGIKILIIVDWGSYLASFENVDIDDQEYLIFRFPYPPRPYSTKDEILAAWVSNEDPQRHLPPPYIPFTGGSSRNL